MGIFKERLSVEVTDACNLRCKSCPRKAGNTYMTGDQFESIMEKVPKPKRVFFHWFGEATLHPHLPFFVASAKSHGASECYVSTNSSTRNLRCGKYVRALFQHLDKITYCVDGWNQETLTKYRVGSNFDNVLRALRMSMRIGLHAPWVRKRMRVLMFPWNEAHVRWFTDVAYECQFDDVSFASPHILCKARLSFEEGHEWLPTEHKYRRYRLDGHSWVHMDGDFCKVGDPVVAANGDVLCCQWDYQHRHILGNIFNDPLDAIDGEFRRLHGMMRARKIDICEGCLCNPRVPVDFVEGV